VSGSNGVMAMVVVAVVVTAVVVAAVSAAIVAAASDAASVVPDWIFVPAEHPAKRIAAESTIGKKRFFIYSSSYVKSYDNHRKGRTERTCKKYNKIGIIIQNIPRSRSFYWCACFTPFRTRYGYNI